MDHQTPHVTRDLCVDLLHGLLGAAERVVVVEHLRDCPACATLFQSSATGFERDHGFLAMPTPRGANVLSRLQRRWHGTGARWGAVAVVAAAAVAIVLIRPPRENVADLLVPLPVRSEDLDLRSAPGITERDELRAGLEAYADGNLEEAVARLRAAPATGAFKTFRSVFLAHALARLGAFREAKRLLDDLDLPSLPDPWRGECMWTLYVADLELGHEQEAARLLQRLAQEPGDVGERARSRSTP